METSPPAHTSRTAAQYGVPYEEALIISKRATNFKDLMTLVAETTAWGIGNLDFSDEELGGQVAKCFWECTNVCPFPTLKLMIRHQSGYTLD